VIGSDYSTAVFHDSWAIGRLRLQPLTIGHALLLQRLRNTFASCDLVAMANAKPGDIAEALIVLGRPWRASTACVQTRRAVSLLRWRAIPLRLRGIREHVICGLVAYFRHHWSGPAVWVKDQSPSGSSADALAVIMSVLITRLGHSHESAMDTPLRRAIWDVQLHLQAEGLVEFVTGADEELFAQAATMKQEAANG
jgi:hypothetical protein